MKKLHYNGPVVLAVLDGVGLRTARSGNAFRQAHTEFLDHALANYLNIPLAASGEAVGIMPGQMGLAIMRSVLDKSLNKVSPASKLLLPQVIFGTPRPGKMP